MYFAKTFLVTHNWPAPKVSGLIAQLVRVFNFFSGFFKQLHKLCLQLQGSFFFWPFSMLWLMAGRSWELKDHNNRWIELTIVIREEDWSMWKSEPSFCWSASSVIFVLPAGFFNWQLVYLLLRSTLEMVLWWGHRQQVGGTTTTGLLSRIKNRYRRLNSVYAFFLQQLFGWINRSYKP